MQLKLIKWLMDGAQTAPSPNTLLSEICERLVTSGVPLWRVGVLIQTLHLDALGRNFVWRPGAEVVIETADFDLPESHRFIQSPLEILYASGHEVGYRLDDPESNRFPFFDEMRAEGVTDYIALPLRLIRRDFRPPFHLPRGPFMVRARSCRATLPSA
jgi:adenylate cyclase